MSNYNPWVTPLNRQVTEDLPMGGKVEYEDIDCSCDVLSSLLYTLFQENWQQVELGHVAQREFDKIKKQQEVEPVILLALNQDWAFEANRNEQLIQQSN